MADRIYRENHSERLLEQKREYYEKNKDKFHAYYESHKEEVRDKNKRYYAENRTYYRQYANQNRDRYRTHCRNRRARIKKAGGMHTASDIQAQYERQKGRCFYCGKKVGDKYHVDHVVPVALGGHNGPENLVIACPDCNYRKNDTHPMEWDGRMF